MFQKRRSAADGNGDAQLRDVPLQGRSGGIAAATLDGIGFTSGPCTTSGNPPRSQCRILCGRLPDRPSRKPSSGTVSNRPARVSEDWRSSVRRGAAQNQETRRQRLAIRQDAQQRKQIGAALDFVNDHQSPERTQRNFRLGKPGQAGRGFEVEIVQGIGPAQMSRARVVLPHWRGPRMPTTLLRFSAVRTAWISVFRSITGLHYTKKIRHATAELHGCETCRVRRNVKGRIETRASFSRRPRRKIF